MRHARARGRTLLTGTTLVVLLVALQPLALGCFPAPCDAQSGIGTGAGDLSAGALGAMVRHLSRDAPAQVREAAVGSVVLLLPPDTARDLARHARARESALCVPACARAGTSDRGYPLLL